MDKLDFINALKVFSSYSIFKINMIWDESEEFYQVLKYLSKKDALYLTKKLFKKQIFLSDFSFNEKKCSKDRFISFWINWDFAFEVYPELKDCEMYKLKTTYPETYRITMEKAKFMMELDYVKFEHPGKTINVYDNLILSELKFGHYKIDQSKKDKIIDYYCNLQVILEQIPFISTMYDIDSYDILLKELGFNLDESFKKELTQLAKKSVKRLYDLAKMSEGGEDVKPEHAR